MRENRKYSLRTLPPVPIECVGALLRSVCMPRTLLAAWPRALLPQCELPLVVCGAGAPTAHAGMLEAARLLLADLDASSVLEHLLYAPGAMCATWSIIVTVRLHAVHRSR